MNQATLSTLLSSFMAESAVAVARVEERLFPGEHWLIAFVPESQLVVAQSLSAAAESALNGNSGVEGTPLVVVFRPVEAKPADDAPEERVGRLAQTDVDQLVQLLEARSRTSDALPSLKYMEDPRASLGAVGASRHQLIFGRRGVGKTALLLEGKRVAEKSGHATVWLNAHALRRLDADGASLAISRMLLASVVKQGGNSNAAVFVKVRELLSRLESIEPEGFGSLLPEINSSLRDVLHADLLRLYLYIDDFYLLDARVQPMVLDNVAAMLRDSNGWIKIASIERLTRAYEPSSRIGLEVPHDATMIDLDVTLEDPAETQVFLETVLANYTDAAGIRSPNSIAKSEALGRLVLASGGVPRDYLNLFASSLIVARQNRKLAREVGREDVALAAGRSARDKKRDLEQDVAGGNSEAILHAIAALSGDVRGRGHAYFRVDVSQKQDRGYELLGLLVDLRFAHLVQASLSDQHKSGIRYEAYVLDLSEWSDVRLRRGLNVLDFENGQWVHRLTGTAGSKNVLAGTRLRDQLRLSPLVDVATLIA